MHLHIIVTVVYSVDDIEKIMKFDVQSEKKKE